MGSVRFSPGDVLRGKYRIKRVLGEGGMGVVVRATHLRLDQDVAIKMLRDEGVAKANIVERFAREARAAARLKGEHAVRILDVDDEGDEPFLVMEYLDGTDLDRLVRRDGPLVVERAVDYALQACEGLAEAHALGIVHRDVKPANLFLAKTPRGGEVVKILDFGISKAVVSSDPTITEGDRILGSPAFMSPEQLKSARDVDARSDVWSLGVVLYFLLCGKLPFDGENATAVAATIASEEPAPLVDVPEALGAVVLRCLAKSRERRFGSVAELAHALAPFASAGDDAARRVSSVLRLPIAMVSSGPSSVAGPAAIAGPATASLEVVNEKMTASLDAPGPVSLGVITGAGETDDKGTTAGAKRKSRSPALGIGAAVVALALAAGWVAVRDGGSEVAKPAATAPQTATASLPPPATVTATATATVIVTATATGPADADAEAKPSVPTKPPTAIATASAPPRPSARPTAAPSDDPLKLELK